MRDNVKTFAEMAAKAFSAPEPVLEIGSRRAEGQEGYAELRSFFVYKAAKRADGLFRRGKTKG